MICDINTSMFLLPILLLQMSRIFRSAHAYTPNQMLTEQIFVRTAVEHHAVYYPHKVQFPLIITTCTARNLLQNNASDYSTYLLYHRP